MSSPANRPAHLHASARPPAPGHELIIPTPTDSAQTDPARAGSGRARAWLRVAIHVGGPLLLVGALAWPLLFTNATFGEDWSNHLWYMWHESLAIRATHLPSLFLDYSGGVFYPYYAFYGGTLYALAGVLSLALGDAPLQAYVLTYLLGFAAAYGGWYWLARMFGVRGWLAHIPALVFVTSASYLTMIYGLGDWPEFLAVSAMPAMIASALALLRAPRTHLWPAITLLASSCVFFGSHILTALWGTTLLVLVGLALVLFVPEARHTITRRGTARVAALVVPALLVSAWFLLPAAAYETQTAVAQSYPLFRGLLQSSMYIVAARHLFTLSRARASGTIVTVALPVLAIAWTLASAATPLCARLRRPAAHRGPVPSRRGPWMRTLLVLTLATALLTVLMTHAGLILALPRVYATLQFSFRLESYVLMGVSGMLLAALVLTTDGGLRVTRWHWLLAPIALVSIGGAIGQVSAYDPAGSRNASLVNRDAVLASYASPIYEQEGLLDYVDDRLPIVRAPLPQVDFPPSTAHGARAVTLSDPPRGRRVDTNLRASPELVHIAGARIVATDAQANDVLELPPATPRSGAVRVTVAPAATLPIVAGRVLSGLALLVLAGELAWIALRRARRR